MWDSELGFRPWRDRFLLECRRPLRIPHVRRPLPSLSADVNGTVLVPNVGVRVVNSAVQEGKIYWLITVPPSTQAPHAVAAPGNDYNFRVHVRNGTTTRTLAESEIAQRYRDRFKAASDDVDRLHEVADAGLRYLGGHVIKELHNGSRLSEYHPVWVTLAAVPAVRGNYPLTTQAERNAAFNRFCMLACQAVTTNMRPHRQPGGAPAGRGWWSWPPV